jgi:hypothetical protein
MPELRWRAGYEAPPTGIEARGESAVIQAHSTGRRVFWCCLTMRASRQWTLQRWRAAAQRDH